MSADLPQAHTQTLLDLPAAGHLKAIVGAIHRLVFLFWPLTEDQFTQLCSVSNLTSTSRQTITSIGLALSVDIDFRFLMPRRQLLIAGENLLLRAIDPDERKIGSLIPSDFATAVLFLLLDIDRSGNYNMTRLAA